MQRPASTHVAGFHTWLNSFERHVKKGEKGIAILAPMIGKKKAENSDETEPHVYGFRTVYVFDRLSRDLWPGLCALDVIRECHFKKSP